MLQLIFLHYCGEYSWCIILEKLNVKMVGTKKIFTIYISILTSLLALSFSIFSFFDFCITYPSFETCCSFVYGLLCQDRLVAVHSFLVHQMTRLWVEETDMPMCETCLIGAYYITTIRQPESKHLPNTKLFMNQQSSSSLCSYSVCISAVLEM